MKAEGEWERFACSGSVLDYLAFKEKETRELQNRQGEQLYAGFRVSDRNDNQDDACW